MSSSTTGKYDQVFAFSQELINSTFQNMYELAILKDPNSPLATFNGAALAVGRFTNCKLGPPKVDLLVNNNDYSSLRYYLSMTTGTLTLCLDDVDPTKTKDFPIKDWLFVFTVRISHTTVPTTDPQYSALSGKVDQGLKDSEFSIAKLWLESSNATYSQPADALLSHTDIVWSDLPDAAENNYNTLMTKWLIMAAKAGQTIIGFTVNKDSDAAKQVNPTAPNFIPSSLGRQTFPYHNGSEPIKDSDTRNALLYLIQTDGHAEPSPATLDPNSGNFIEGDGPKGLFLMQRQQFWNQWLLPLLQEINQRTEVWVDKPEVKVWDESGTDYASATCFSVLGHNPSHTSKDDTYFDFQEQVQPGALSWAWNSDFHNETASAETGIVFTFKDTVTNSSRSWSGIVINTKDPSIIEVSGGSETKIDEWLTGTETGPTKSESHITLQATWEMGIQIQTVGSGDGVQMALLPPSMDGKRYKIDVVKNEDMPPWITSNWDEYTENVKNDFDAKFSNLDSIENDLFTSLQYQHKLYLPAEGEYLFSNGRINLESDFMVDCQWNGAEAPGLKCPPGPIRGHIMNPRPYHCSKLKLAAETRINLTEYYKYREDKQKQKQKQLQKLKSANLTETVQEVTL